MDFAELIFITLVANKASHHSGNKPFPPLATLQQLVLPGLIMEQTLRHASSDNSGW